MEENLSAHFFRRRRHKFFIAFVRKREKKKKDGKLYEKGYVNQFQVRRREQGEGGVESFFVPRSA